MPSPRRKPGIDERRWPRHARRIPCTLWIQGKSYSGIVKDLSRAGLFVATRAKAQPGSAVTLAIAASEDRAEIRVSGRVARSDQIRSRLAMQGAGGLGIEFSQIGALDQLLGDNDEKS